MFEFIGPLNYRMSTVLSRLIIHNMYLLGSLSCSVKYLGHEKITFILRKKIPWPNAVNSGIVSIFSCIETRYLPR